MEMLYSARFSVFFVQYTVCSTACSVLKIVFFFKFFCVYHEILNKKIHKAPMWYLKKIGALLATSFTEKVANLFCDRSAFLPNKVTKNLLFISVRGACGV